MSDKFNTLNKRLKEVVEAYNELKRIGMHEDILIAYIKDKTGISKRDIQKMLEATEDFYNKMVDTELEENI